MKAILDKLNGTHYTILGSVVIAGFVALIATGHICMSDAKNVALFLLDLAIGAGLIAYKGVTAKKKG